MSQTRTVRKLQRAHWRTLEKLIKRAYEDGFEAGVARSHGQGRRGRTIRGDATVAGLIERIGRHFGLDRYGFEVRIVHGASHRRVPAGDLLRRYRIES